MSSQEQLLFRWGDKLVGRCGPEVIPFSTDRLVNDEGIDVVLSLHEVEDDRIKLWERSGLDVKTCFYPDKELLEPDERIDFIERCVKPAVDLIEEKHEDRKRVLLHSHTARNRTCAVMASWVIKHRGLFVAGAIDQVKRRKEYAFDKRGYEEAVRRYSNMEHSNTPHRGLRIFLTYFRVRPHEKQDPEAYKDFFLSQKAILSALYSDRTIQSRTDRPGWLDEWGIVFYVRSEDEGKNDRTERFLYTATVDETILVHDEDQLEPFRSFLLNRYEEGEDEIFITQDGKLVLDFSTIYQDREAMQAFLEQLLEDLDGAS